MNTERAAVLASTLEEYRQNRHKIRAVEIISDCCPTCSLDSGREFSLEAVPLLPHSYCTNPEGCQCYYSPVAISAPSVPEEEPPVVYSTPVVSLPPGGFPAHLKTPTAAMIVLGGIVIAFGIAYINNTTGRNSNLSIARPLRTVPYVPVSQVSQINQRPASTPQVSVSTYNPRWVRDREIEAKAARDLNAAESIARANEEARRAQEVAVQQQIYLRNLLSRQSQAPQSRSPSIRRSAGTAREIESNATGSGAAESPES